MSQTNANDQAWLPDPASTQAVGASMAEIIQTWGLMRSGFHIHLQGDLGAGKSTLARALIQSFLPTQKVKSPTFTLVESYPVVSEDASTSFHLVHFDCYRLSDPEELEFLGVRDLLTPPYVALVEWPQKGMGVLPAPDWRCDLTLADPGDVAAGRRLQLHAGSDLGDRALRALQATTQKVHLA